MLLPVIAGVDGSPESLAAAEWAAREAVRRGRPLHLVHAWNWQAGRPDGEPAGAAQRHLARRALRAAEDRVRGSAPGLRTTDEQVGGPATAALLRAAERAELLVLGSRGLSAFAGLLVGSVALGVIARAPVPVVLVRAGEEADGHPRADGGGPSTRTGPLDVVLGIDLADPCDEVLAFAFEAARLRGARLRVVHAWQPASAIGLGSGDIGLLGAPSQAGEWRQFLSAVLRVWRDKYPEVEVLETVVRGRASAALVRAASAAGLLVVGRRTADRPTLPRTGPVTHAAVQHVRCPLAVVPHP